MKINDNLVDDLLKGLADYKPEAKPDWESFYADYKNDISKTAESAGTKKAGKFISSTGIRNLAITLFAVTSIIIAYFLFFSSSDDSVKDDQTIQVQPRTDENSVVPNTTLIQNDAPNKPANQILNSSGIPANSLLENSGSGTITGGSPIVPDNAEQSIIEKSDKTNPDLSTDKNENTISTVDSLKDQPVVIKKTIILTDTLKITRPQKK